MRRVVGMQCPVDGGLSGTDEGGHLIVAGGGR